ncbi:MAG: CueP family metal-binding protein [Candidatus Nanopelagicales bacterium]|uniref:CueP family metal-binding protein n=1 Tax=Rhodococcus pyridinivorans TaxID=103816 RepID=UPI00265A0BE2|nr:CueP family metal-binding protein [Rhodococcus pyridinivorans]MCO5299339.1 CueP family metal-binding protein [Candidatus Nanopelagicales bacterium]HPE11214.1 CueP family metal-binding protein [Actinomycetota bacterium]HRV64729.1 CueP family metal-binding protein [Candidatus Nanopelagicales bacterium]
MNRFRPLPGGTGIRSIVVTALALGAIILSGCASIEDPTTSTQGSPGDGLLAEHSLDGLQPGELVNALDAMPLADRPNGLATSITADFLTLTDQHNHTAQVALPSDAIYVSVAPYQSETHDCYVHSPTGCVGELRNADIDVVVTDSETGETILSESTRTFDNGFVGLWLPRDIDSTITITHGGQVVTSSLSTIGDDAQTCITTMRLT